MPLPRIKKFCTAKCKATGVTCLNPASFGQAVCRYHGARRPSSIQRSAAHPRFKTGQYTQATKDAYKAAVKKLMQIEELGFKAGWMSGERTRGRKP